MLEQPDPDKSLRRMIDKSLDPAVSRPLSDDEIESLLDTANAQPMADEHVERILQNAMVEVPSIRSVTNRLPAIDMPVATEQSTESAAARHDRNNAEVYSTPQPSRQSSTEEPEMKTTIASRNDQRTVRRRAAATVVVIVGLSLLMGVGLFFSNPNPRTESQPSVSSLSSVVQNDTNAATVESLSRDQLKQLVARTVPQTTQPNSAGIGTRIATKDRERRRVTLPDGSILYVNQNTVVDVESARLLKLSVGEVFVEVATRVSTVASDTRESGATVNAKQKFVVRTADRDVTALGTKFAVRRNASKTGVVVTQGKVKVSGLELLIEAGQELVPAESADGNQPKLAPARRASQVLSWTKDLMAAAETPLVPNSKHQGGSLITIDPSGQETKLTLRKFHVDVHIEDGFARTTIDQTYFNNQWQRLEGTFYFPLPADASLSRLAMYVGENLMEGGMVERNRARNVFEQIRYTRRDPALLEWVDGSTFKMRVFPLEPRQEKRLVLSYTQKLNSAYGETTYRFPAGHNLELVRDWSTHIRVKHGAKRKWSSPSHDLTQSREGQDLILEAAAEAVALDNDIVLKLRDARQSKKKRDAVEFSTSRHEGQRYLMLRFRPHLQGKLNRPRRNWVFLFESSGDRDPLLARVQIDVIKTLLKNAEHDDTFAIVTAGTRTKSFAKQPVECLIKQIDAAVAFLEKTHLIGAFDCRKALDAAAKLYSKKGEQYLVHVGSAIPVLGEKKETVLAAQIPKRVRYVGIGVGKRWSRQFMKAAARRTGGFVTQINPDEKVGWRTFELLSTLNAPRLLEVAAEVTVRKSKNNLRFLQYTDSLSQGEQFCAITRLDADAPLPESITVTGMLNGKRYERKIPVDDVAEDAGYLPRSWARLEIDRLVDAGIEQHRQAIISLSKSMYVMSPLTSLLVLENEAMYKQFQVDRGRKDHWALYSCPQKIKVVHEPHPTPWEPKSSKPKTEVASNQQKLRQLLDSIVWKSQPRLMHWPNAVQPFDYRFTAGKTVQWQLGFDFNRPFIGGNQQSQESLYVPLHSFSVHDADSLFNLNIHGNLQGLRLDRGLGIPSFGRIVDGTSSTISFEDELRRFDATFTVNPLWNGEPSHRHGPVNAQTLEKLRLKKLLQDLNKVIGRERDVRVKSTWTQWRGPRTVDGRGVFDNYWGWRNVELNRAPGYHWRYSDFNPLDSGSQAIPNSGVYQLPPYGWFRQESSQRKVDELYAYGLREIPRIVNGTVDGRNNDATTYFGLSRRIADYELAYRMQCRGNVVSSLAFTPDGKLLFGTNSEPVTRLWELPSDFNGNGRRDIRVLNELDFLPTFGSPQLRLAHNRLEVRHQTLPAVRPDVGNDRGAFGDLPAHAPGLNTTNADVLALLDAETPDAQRTKPGRVDASARRLINAARQRVWESITIDGRDGEPGLSVHYDGAGRFRFERIVSEGLREQVVCDGKTLWHLYDELGIGARRAASRFHRAELRSLVPWLLPPIEELALGFDLKSIGKHTISIRPAGIDQRTDGNGKPVGYLASHLTFGGGGRLQERRLVLMPQRQTLSRVTIEADGTVKLFDAKDNVVVTLSLHRAASATPNLTPDTSQLVVLPLPYRTAARVLQRINRNAKDTKYASWSKADAIELIAADYAAGNLSRMLTVIRKRFFDRSDVRVGFSVLVAARFHQFASTPVAAGFKLPSTVPDTPLSQFLRQYLRWCRSGNSKAEFVVAGPSDGFIQRQAAARNLYVCWKHGQVTKDRSKQIIAVELNRALKFIGDCRSRKLGWALLTVVQHAVTDKDLQRRIADAAEQFENVPGLQLLVRHERARGLFKAGDAAQARKQIRKLYLNAAQVGFALPIDADIRKSFSTNDSADWDSLLQDIHKQLLSDKRLRTALLFALHCRHVGDVELGDELFENLVDALSPIERPDVGLMAAEYLRQMKLYKQADELVTPLLDDKRFESLPQIWRLASQLSEQRGKTAESLRRQERALDLEFTHLPDLVNLETIRRDYSDLMRRYNQVVDASAILEIDPPGDLVERLIRSADRWRSLDTDDTAACQSAARVIRKLDDNELAWDYLTTPLAMRPNESAPWISLAQTLAKQGDVMLADRAYQSAFEAEPTNPQILWDHAQLLRQHSQIDAANKLRLHIINNKWQPRFSGVQQKARKAVGF